MDLKLFTQAIIKFLSGLLLVGLLLFLAAGVAADRDSLCPDVHRRINHDEEIS